MFISVLDLFKVGIGPSSSHTLGPLVAARSFLLKINQLNSINAASRLSLRCTLKGSLAFTGKGHGTDKAIILGLHGFTPEQLVNGNNDELLAKLSSLDFLQLDNNRKVKFAAQQDIVFDRGLALTAHPNGMIFELLDHDSVALSETYFSIGGGFISTLAEMNQLVAPLKMQSVKTCPYPFDSANSMLQMAKDSGLSIAQMKWQNEKSFRSEDELRKGLAGIWKAMQTCVQNGLQTSGELPGGLKIQRRAKALYAQLQGDDTDVSLNDWLSVYAMAVNEENAAGHMVVTAPTNGAAGVVPALLYYLSKHRQITESQVYDFLLTASAIGGIIKYRSSISGAEVGCQGEVGSAAAMAAAGMCAIKGGTPPQIENAAEIALEHHLGMTCDPVNGLVQVPCIERNAFGAIKAHAAAMLALRGSGTHFVSLDSCIAAMKQTGMEMSEKYKETALGGLAVSFTEC